MIMMMIVIMILIMMTREAGKHNLRFLTLPASLGLGHCDIYSWDGLDSEVTGFVSEVAKHIVE